eukprot:TRINITY_DN19430_c0_g2_i1.p1 TRINITY_DN19430_c0_g2~~TRINITY_DN19430_c0_g2_i1.p1  ORF type:complete len:697 (+),score=262.31 TRINITY_DN19430_c0_g2_i1:62-2152(+)
MGKRKAAKQSATPAGPGGLSGITTQQQSEKLLNSWTVRELQLKLQCAPDEAQLAAGMVMSMSAKQLREWCNDLLSETEKRLDEDRRFYNQFMDKKEEFGLMNPPVPTASDAVSDAGTATTSATSKGKGKNKYNRQVDLSKTKGADILIPFSQECNCEARKHKLLTNCQMCGKVVCEQEGWGRCYFCGSFLKGGSAPVLGKDETEEDEDYKERERAFLKAVAQRDKLLQFQDERSKRTTIFDDQEDYYASSNPWLDDAERRKAREKEQEAAEARKERHRKGGAYTVTLDFINKNVAVGGEADVQGLHHAPKPVKLEAPAAAREREGKEEDEENPENIQVSHNVYRTENTTRVVADGGDDDDDNNDGTDGNAPDTRVAGLRVMRCPNSHTEILFDQNATLTQWVEETLQTYGFSEEESAKHSKYLVRMTSRGMIKGWMDQHIEGESDFLEAFEAEAQRLHSKAAHDGKLTRAVKEEKDHTAPEEGKADVSKQRQRGLRGTGRLQFDYEELEEEQAGAVQAMAKAAKRGIKKKPWVYINSDEANKLDYKLNCKEGSNMCLTMHQPWASLLVCGIKKHEGRTWPTDYRGRLWIHAASHQPTEESIESVENFYAARGANNFPSSYPTSVLLGCVTVDDCLHLDDYREQVPPADQESESEYVFLCSNPQLLVLPLPMDGNHKIYQLTKSVTEAVKRQAGRPV